MCYEENDYSLDSFDGIRVKVMGSIEGKLHQIADVFIEDGTGIDLLVRLVEYSRSDWEDISYEVSTVRSIDDVVYDEIQGRQTSAFVRLFLDEFEYGEFDEKARYERLQGIAEITGGSTQISRRYMGFLYQIDKSLVPDGWEGLVEHYPPFVDERQLKELRKSLDKGDRHSDR